MDAIYVNREGALSVFLNLSPSSLKTVRKYLNLHPIIESECASTYFTTKDDFIDFGDYQLLSINEIPPDDEIELTLGVKLIIFPDHILAFVSQEAFCL